MPTQQKCDRPVTSAQNYRLSENLRGGILFGVNTFPPQPPTDPRVPESLRDTPRNLLPGLDSQNLHSPTEPTLTVFPRFEGFQQFSVKDPPTANIRLIDPLSRQTPDKSGRTAEMSRQTRDRAQTFEGGCDKYIGERKVGVPSI